MDDPRHKNNVWRFLALVLVLALLVLGQRSQAQPIAELGVRYHTNLQGDNHPGFYLYVGKIEFVLLESSPDENATIISLLVDGELRYPLEGDVGLEVVVDQPLFTLSGRVRAGVLNHEPMLDMRLGVIITIGR